MCFHYEVGPPSIYRCQFVTARKPRECSECFLSILKGERYHYVFGVWEGSPSTYSICEQCQWLRERIAESERKAGCGSYGVYPPLGDLHDCLEEGHYRSLGWVPLEME